MARLCGYVRVSRTAGRSGASFISPKVQRERAEAVARAGGHHVTDWLEDLDESGASAERPGFVEVIRRIEAGETGGVVVAKLDRFSRSVADAAAALRRIDGAGGVFLSAEDSLDTSTPMGRFALHMMLAFAELEWEQRREGWAVARANAVERGIHIASRTPTGYDRMADKRLAPNPSARRVAEAFRARAAGESWSAIARIMDGVETPYGSTRWTTRSLSHLLANRVYLGEARSGAFVLPGAHEAVIDEATFRLAQRRPQRQPPGHGESLLAGLLRCAGCRYAMKSDRMSPKTGPLAGERVRTYRCRERRAMGDCLAPTSTLAHVIEPWVESAFLRHAGGISVGQATDDTEARAEVEAARVQRDAFLTLDIDDPAVAQAELDRRQERLDAAENHLALLHPPDSLDSSVVGEWPGLTLGERREVLALGIDAVFLRRAPRQGLSAIDDRAVVLWRGEGPADLPGPGRRGVPLVPYEW